MSYDFNYLANMNFSLRAELCTNALHIHSWFSSQHAVTAHLMVACRLGTWYSQHTQI